MKDELERLFNNNILKSKNDATAEADGMDKLPKRALFDRTNDFFIGYHPNFAEGEQLKNYEGAMTLVAMSFDDSQWDRLIGLDQVLDDQSMRTLAKSVEDSTLLRATELEVEVGLRQKVMKTKHQPTLHSFALRFNKICKRWKDSGKNDGDIKILIDQKTGDRTTGTVQPSLNRFFQPRS